MEARVRKGLSIEKAAHEAGLSREGFAKALRRPAVAALVEQTRDRMIREYETLRASARTLALETARHLLETGSEATRLKVIGILLATDKPLTAVPQVQVNMGVGYEFVRPGQRVVDVTTGDGGEISEVADAP